MRFCTVLPIKTSLGLNAREHWRVRSNRVRKEREAAAWVTPPAFPLPCSVRLTRLSAGTLDGDNLPGACKAIRDGIADKLGIKDNDPRVLWSYEQEKVAKGRWGVRIELESA